jgi:tetratricopeptide (TPR) repeat protein
MTKGLADSEWVDNDGDKGFKIIQLYRNDCPDSPHVEMQFERQDNKAMCVYADFLVEHAGKIEEAGELYEEALEMREGIYGGDHPDVADSLNRIGRWKLFSGDTEGANENFDDALAMFRRVYEGDENHLEVANTLLNIGDVQERIGEFDLAESTYRRALNIQRSRLGGHHREIARTKSEMAEILWQRGDFDGAEEQFQGALEIEREVLIPDSVERADTLNRYALFLNEGGITGEAVEMLCEALRIQEHVYGEESLNLKVAMTQSNLGMVLQNMGYLSGAEEMFRGALGIYERSGDEQSTVDVTHNLSTVLVDIGEQEHARGEIDKARERFEEAASNGEQALDFYRKSENNPEAINALVNLGLASEFAGRSNDALDYFNEALELQRILDESSYLMSALSLHIARVMIDQELDGGCEI